MGCVTLFLVKKMLDELAVTSSAPPEVHDVLAFQIPANWCFTVWIVSDKLIQFMYIKLCSIK